MLHDLRGLRGLLGTSSLPRPGGAAVLVLHDREPDTEPDTEPGDAPDVLVADLLALDPAAQVVVRATGADGRPPVATLAAQGPFDLVVDRTTSPGKRKRVKALVPLVRAGGRLVSVRGDRPDGDRPDDAETFLRRLTTVNASRPSLADVLGRTTVTDGWIGIDVVRDSLVKVFETEIDDFRSAAGVPADATTVVHPAQPWTATGVLHGSDPARAAALPTSFEGFELVLRSYDDAWCLHQSAVVADGVALPDSFRRSFADIYANAQLDSLSQRAALPPAPPRQRLAGTYLLLDNEWRGQFGHNLLEQVSRTWAWAQATADHPDVSALVTARRHVPVAPWEYELLEAAGVPRDRVVVAREPVEVERLLTATGAYYLPSRAHPELVALYRRMAERLWEPPSDGAYPERLFFSRKEGSRRGCLNGRRVEEIFEAHGFAVVYPEDHPLAVQMSMVRSCQVFAGFAGSGMYHLALTAGCATKQVIALTAATYVEVVESVFASLYGHELWMVWCDDVEPNTDKMVQSDYWFGEADETYLRSVLDGLDRDV